MITWKVFIIPVTVPNKPISAIYFDPDKNRNFLKRFLIENHKKEDSFINPDKKLIFINTDWRPIVSINFYKSKGEDISEGVEINIEDFISVKGYKAQGNQLTDRKIKNIEIKKLLPYNENDIDIVEIEVKDEEEIEIEDQESNQIKMDI